MVANTFIFGSSPKRILEKITCGSVDEPGPDKNEVITTSSSDSVMPSRKPDAMAGAIRGSVITKKIFIGRAPKSIAASSSDWSSSAKRERITTVIYAMHSVVCPKKMVKKPRSSHVTSLCSQPCSMVCTWIISSSMDKPVITSGITIGAEIRPANSVLPRKRLIRAIA